MTVVDRRWGGLVAPALVLLATVGALGCRCGAGPAASAGAQAPPEEVDVSEQTTRIRELLGRLGEDADPLHMDMTPAVQELAAIGLPVLPHLEDALLSDDEMTRLHAQRVLEGAVYRHHGFRPGRGWEHPEGEARVRAVFQANGTYDFEAPPEKRREVVRAWMDWYDREGGG